MKQLFGSAMSVAPGTTLFALSAGPLKSGVRTEVRQGERITRGLALINDMVLQIAAGVPQIEHGGLSTTMPFSGSLMIENTWYNVMSGVVAYELSR